MQYDENAEKYGYEGEMTPIECDELKAYGMGDPAIDEEYEMYKVADVDAVIAKLKNENLSLKAKNIELQSFCDLHGNVDNYIDKVKAENAELKQKLEDVQASMYCDVVDANMEVRRLRRALYKACANWAHHRVFVRFRTDEKAWENMERKCRAMAEKFK